MSNFKPKYVSFNIVEDYINPTVELPTLYMDINPATFDQSFKKKINRYQTFSAFIEEFWGEELDVINCSGSTGGFLLFEDSTQSGLTALARNYTPAYAKFKDLLDLYRNNGNIYDEDGVVIKKGNIIMNFDVSRYIGHFQSFNYTEDANIPFRFTFDFIFNVEQSLTEI